MKLKYAQLSLGLKPVVTTAVGLALAIANLAWGEDVGLGKLIPGRYLSQVRQGTADKLPEIKSAKSSDLRNFKKVPADGGSVPNADSFVAARESVPVSPALVAKPKLAAPPNLAYAPIESGKLASKPGSVPGSVPGSSSPNVVLTPSMMAFRAVASVPSQAVPSPVQPASGFVAGSIGDLKGSDVTGLGKGWTLDGARSGDLDLSLDSYDSAKVLEHPGSEPPAKEQAVSRLLASVQAPTEQGESPAEIAQAVDQDLKSDTYRSLSSVLSFQEMPRGNMGGSAQPKQLWANPDPSTRIKFSKDALNSQHSKEVIGQASSAFRRTPDGVADGKAHGLKTTLVGDAGGLGQAGGIYSASASGAPAHAVAPAVISTNPFPLPFLLNTSTPSSSSDSQ